MNWTWLYTNALGVTVVVNPRESEYSNKPEMSNACKASAPCLHMFAPAKMWETPFTQLLNREDPQKRAETDRIQVSIPSV